MSRTFQFNQIVFIYLICWPCLICHRLTMQACIYCFDKAANENATRSQYKLNMRIYYEDFLSALTSAAQFKYSGQSGGDHAGWNRDREDDRQHKLKKLVNACCQSMAMKVWKKTGVRVHACMSRFLSSWQHLLIFASLFNVFFCVLHSACLCVFL